MACHDKNTHRDFKLFLFKKFRVTDYKIFTTCHDKNTHRDFKPCLLFMFGLDFFNKIF